MSYVKLLLAGTWLVVGFLVGGYLIYDNKRLARLGQKWNAEFWGRERAPEWTYVSQRITLYICAVATLVLSALGVLDLFGLV